MVCCIATLPPGAGGIKNQVKRYLIYTHMEVVPLQINAPLIIGGVVLVFFVMLLFRKEGSLPWKDKEKREEPK